MKVTLLQGMSNEIQTVPIYNWCNDIEKGAFTQAENLAMHPMVVDHVALMPDAHQGYGMPVGGVAAVKDAVIPNAVGVDIGCGMIAQKTNCPVDALKSSDLLKMMGLIREAIPVGFKHHKYGQSAVDLGYVPDIPIVKEQIGPAYKQVGTLGGGNHFIEIQAGDDGFIWFMVHSGSRNVGFKIANHYNKLAQKLCHRWQAYTVNSELCYLPIGEPAAQEYIEAMNFALNFAFISRVRMMQEIVKAFKSTVKWKNSLDGDFINIHHNFAVLENHKGQNAWIHRKGATRAFKGWKGIIPGSMGTSSYIVEGLGNRDSFMSCSHGAGRTMSRTEASKTLSEEECNKAMEGVVFGRWGRNRKGGLDLSEAPGAYKDIDDVIKAELDLIRPIVKLRPLGVIKG